MTGVQTCALRSEEHTSELQSHDNLVCRLLLEKKKPHICIPVPPPTPPPRAAGAGAARPGGCVLGGGRRGREAAAGPYDFFFLKWAAPAEHPPFPPPRASPD